jgi:hypothetical protein
VYSCSEKKFRAGFDMTDRTIPLLDIMTSLTNSSIVLRYTFSDSQTLIKKHVNKIYFNDSSIHSNSGSIT